MAKKKFLDRDTFLSNTANAGLNLGKAYADWTLSALGMEDVIPEEAYKGNTGDAFGKVSNVAGQIVKAAAPIAANIVAPGSGSAVSGAQGLGAMVNKPLGVYAPKPETPKQQSFGTEFESDKKMPPTYRAYKHGGEVEDEMEDEDEMTLINVEKGEIEVHPETCDILQEFNDVPKHPKGKDIVNLKGDVYVRKSSVIIPANRSAEYMKADKNGRARIIRDVKKVAESRKMEDGGLTPMAEGGTGNGVGDYSGAVGMAAAAPKLAFGIAQTVRAKKALKDLAKKPMPRYDVTREQRENKNRALASFGRAEGLAKEGFTAAEEAAFNQNLARANATTLYNTRNKAGGQMQGAVSASLGSQNINALLDFAAKDAQLNRQNIAYADRIGQYLGRVNDDITQQKNTQTGLDVQRRLMQEQSLGQALSQGRVNTTDASSQIAGNAALLGSQLFA